MKTTKIKTADLTGNALDWAVAKSVSAVMFNKDCEFGQKYGWLVRTGGVPCVISGEPVYVWISLEEYNPTTNWGQLGPLVDKYWGEICTQLMRNFGGDDDHWWCRLEFEPNKMEFFCWAIVSSELGQTVDVPEVLA